MASSILRSIVEFTEFPITAAGRTRRPRQQLDEFRLSGRPDLVANRTDVRAEGGMGFQHRGRPGRMSLAADLMEELRAPLADRVALSLVNRRQIRPGDVDRQETGAVLLTDRGRQIVLRAYRELKRVEVHHAWADERAPLGLVSQLQARLLARRLRGDIDFYPAWVWS